MLPLPTRLAGLILAFAPLFVRHSWRHAQRLLIGAILTPGRRTVASVLRIMGRTDERRFVDAYNHGRRLKTLRGLTPYDFVCQAWTKQPDRFTRDPSHHMPGPNI